MCSLLSDKKNTIKLFLGEYINKVKYVYAKLNLPQEYNSILSRDSPAKYYKAKVTRSSIFRNSESPILH